jgi:DNA-binding NtrC family response regulator
VVKVENLGLPKSKLNFKDRLKNMSLKNVARQAERARIIEVLQQTNWNRTKTAETLDISARTLRYKLKEYNISSGN